MHKLAKAKEEYLPVIMGWNQIPMAEFNFHSFASGITFKGTTDALRNLRLS
jgi:hypothetical protein